MTTTATDSPAVIEANLVLAEASPTVTDLSNARDGIVAELGELESVPDIRPDEALSVAEYERQKAEREHIILRKRIARDLYAHLNERHARAHAEAAVATAVDDRQLLEDALTVAGEAQHQLEMAKRSAVLAAQALAGKRKHVGRDDRSVGATADQMARLFEFHGIHEDPEHQYRDRHKESELKRLRLTCMIPEDGQPIRQVQPTPVDDTRRRTSWPAEVSA